MADEDRAVVWHDAECGAYTADLDLWEALAREQEGPVLDIGAGTGRVALHLAQAGFAVTAVDHDPALVEALATRAAGLPVTPVAGDATALDLGQRFPLCIVPMQTVQVLGGRRARAAFLAGALRHLRPGGLLAAALADVPVPYTDVEPGALPLPDMLERDGWVFSSQPVAIRHEDGQVVIERLREAVAPDGARTAGTNLVRLDRLAVSDLEGEARAAGFEPDEPRAVAPTGDHVGSDVALLRRPSRGT